LKDVIKDSCAGMEKYQNVNYYFNDIDLAIDCAKKVNKPILIQFSNWQSSNRDFLETVLADKKIKAYLNNEMILLVLMNDDKHPFKSNEKSLLNTIIAIEENNTIGNINKKLKNHFIQSTRNTSEPQYIIIDSKLNKLAAPWGYTKDPNRFINEFEKISN